MNPHKVFIFNERQEISFSLVLFSKSKSGRVPCSLLCKIRLEEDGEIVLYTTDSCNLINFTKEFSKKDFSIKNAKIGNVDIKLIIDQPIHFTRFEHKTGKNVSSMKLKHFSYSINNVCSDYIYRLSPSSNFLQGYLSEFVVNGNTVVGIAASNFECVLGTNKFTFSRDDEHIYIQTKGDQELDLLLSLTSLFSCKPIEIDMQYTDGTIKVSTPHSKLPLNQKCNNVLGYLFHEGICLDYFTDFILLFSNTDVDFIKEEIFLYVDNLVRAEYLDEIAKLILYNSILEKMAKVQQGKDSWECIKRFLLKHHINYVKINEGINKILDNENKPIDNFVKLRNFFIHQLGDEKAKHYIQNSEMLFKLKLTITILILNLLGINDIRFDKCFHNISVYDNTINEIDFVSKMLNR